MDTSTWARSATRQAALPEVIAAARQVLEQVVQVAKEAVSQDDFDLALATRLGLTLPPADSHFNLVSRIAIPVTEDGLGFTDLGFLWFADKVSLTVAVTRADLYQASPADFYLEASTEVSRGLKEAVPALIGPYPGSMFDLPYGGSAAD